MNNILRIKFLAVAISLMLFAMLGVSGCGGEETESSTDWIQMADNALESNSIDSLRNAWKYFNEAYKEDSLVDRQIVRDILDKANEQYKHYIKSDTVNALNIAADYCNLMSEISEKIYPDTRTTGDVEQPPISLPENFPVYGDWDVVAHKKELSSRYMSQGITAVDLCEKYSDPVECDRIKESFEKAVFYDDNARTREYKNKYCK